MYFSLCNCLKMRSSASSSFSSDPLSILISTPCITIASVFLIAGVRFLFAHRLMNLLIQAVLLTNLFLVETRSRSQMIGSVGVVIAAFTPTVDLLASSAIICPVMPVLQFLEDLANSFLLPFNHGGP